MQVTDFIQFRREIHQNAELSGKEKETKKRIQNFICQFNPDEIIEVGKYGLIFAFKGAQPGPAIMIRSEMDALPIQEVNTFGHKSVHEGVSHKCGHDGHMAILANVAYRISRNRPEKGICYLLYQPAEEIGEGAKEVFNDPKFQALKIDRILALHNLPGFPKQLVLVKDGPFTPAVSSIAVKFQGKTSHAAEPEHGINPGAAMSEFLLKSLSLVQPDPNKSDFFLVTPIHMTLGEKNYGISAGYGEVHLTLRSIESDILSNHFEQLKSITRELAETNGLKIEIVTIEDFKANINQSAVVDGVRQAARELGYELQEMQAPMKWGEDFGLLTQQIPGAMFGIGSGENSPALHNDDYDFPDELIEVGARMFERVIQNFLAN